MLRLLVLFLLVFNLLSFGAEKYFCPMRCEGPMVYEKAGSCPVCHMYLEKEPEPGAETGPLSSKDYRVDLKSTVISTSPQHQIEITITPRSTQNDSVFKDLENTEGVELEVYVTTQDLSYMDYVIPQKSADGSFTFKKEFYKSQNALLFAVFKPKGIRQQTFPLALKVDVQKAKAKPITPKTKPSKEEFGYFVVVSEDTTYFVREHASMKAIRGKQWKEELKKKLPKPGKYKVFIQPEKSASLEVSALIK